MNLKKASRTCFFKLTLAIAPLLFSTFIEFIVVLPSVFSYNIVLQQKTNAAIWGKAKAGAKITVIPSWNLERYTGIADANGNWKIKVLTPSYGGPYTLRISDGEPVVLKNILIGDVWVCSGQSNMEMPLAGWGKVQNYAQEIAQANYPSIRLLQVEHITANQVKDDATVTNGGWTACSPATVAEFSSTAYFFAREIYQKTKIPIGLLHTSWGGTIAEAWMSSSSLKRIPAFAAAVEEIERTPGEDKNYADKLLNWQKIVLDKDLGYHDQKPIWSAEDADVSSWAELKVPGLWENELKDMDGAVWLSRKITLPENWAGKSLKVNIGPVDDDEISWFNGSEIGRTQGYNQPRIYTIPGNLVKAGENTITVRVFDSGGGGGMYGEEKDLQFTGPDGKKVGLSGSWKYRVGLNLKDAPPMPASQTGPNRPSVLYNAMIHPFLPFSIRGVIWYQGESNADRAHQYESLFPSLIKDWRSKWNEGDFPFYFVQLASFMKREEEPVPSKWAELRDAQLKTLSLPNTGMAVAIDIGDAKDIHPKNKQEVGRRLALIALARNYQKKISYSGPQMQSFKVEGDKVRISFVHADAGLKVQDGTVLKGFVIAGADQKFYRAKAVIEGNTVVVSSDLVKQPVAVRYAWENNPDCNLYSGAGLPASPFRTDTWKGITE
ncbi:9-O-acetylesterase [Pedobacter sp. HMWF019]|uniref:sialate O-acetylesterase n=1 Tax=Pedobacter sp. HMWF019 TaxID=2056856 RepID=UPI000D346725|nr:sialate O-acetylesterase [Pedobacter sp. HMWF019]PTT04095.1 9-O-acetylesterase [Pedobacter sp. HMWF019]